MLKALGGWFDATILDLGRQLRLLLPAAADGLPRRRDLRAHGDRRHLLHQGLSRAVGGVSRRARLLGRNSVGIEDAARPSGRPDLAPKVPAGLSRRRPDRAQHRHHVRPDRAHRGDGQAHGRRGLVRAERAAGAGRLRRPGRRRGCHDRRGGAAARRAGPALPRGRDQGDAHHHADARAVCGDRWPHARGGAQHLDVRGRRDDVGSREDRGLRADLPDGAGDPGALDHGRDPRRHPPAPPGAPAAGAGRRAGAHRRAVPAGRARPARTGGSLAAASRSPPSP